MDIKLFDSELKVMSVLWREGDIHCQTSVGCFKRRDRLEHEHHVYTDKALYQKCLYAGKPQYLHGRIG